MRKAKELYYNEMLISFINKLKMSWNNINNVIGTASNKKFTQTELKLGNNNISTKQSS